MRNVFLLLASVAAVTLCPGCPDRQQRSSTAVAVTNSYLASAVRDVAGADFDVITLAAPGMCPGHFDISPGQVSQLAQCRVLLMFDFQQSLDQTLERLKNRGLATASIEASEGMAVPDSYLAMCRQVAQVLAEHYPEKADDFSANLALLDTKLADYNQQIQRRLNQSQLAGTAVVTSAHQRAFAQHLGLDVRATFRGQDIETIGRINALLSQSRSEPIAMVIANVQEGTDLARAIAEQLDVPYTVFSNFPQAHHSDSFANMLMENVENLIRAAQ